MKRKAKNQVTVTQELNKWKSDEVDIDIIDIIASCPSTFYPPGMHTAHTTVNYPK
jgi:hypothetical protein